MAITTNVNSAAIHSNGSSITNFIPAVWSAKILEALEVEAKLVDNCWREYEGEVKHASAVHILGVGDVTVGDYGSKDIDVERIDDAGQTLIIDQAKYFAIEFDDVEKAQTVPGLFEATQKEAVHKLAVARDSFVALKIKEGTHITTAASLEDKAVKAAIDAGLVQLKKRNFNEEAVIELSPEGAMAFMNDLTVVSTDNPEYIKKGVIGYYHGHKVIESNNLFSDETHTYCAIRGKKAIAFAGQLDKVEAIRRELRFSDMVRGLDVYGAKVIDDDRLQVIKIPVLAEA